jgi:hypothetical protein
MATMFVIRARHGFVFAATRRICRHAPNKTSLTFAMQNLLDSGGICLIWGLAAVIGPSCGGLISGIRFP